MNPQAVRRSTSRSPPGQPVEELKVTGHRGPAKAAAKRDKKEKKDLRKGPKADEGVLRA